MASGISRFWAGALRVLDLRETLNPKPYTLNPKQLGGGDGGRAGGGAAKVLFGVGMRVSCSPPNHNTRNSKPQAPKP